MDPQGTPTFMRENRAKRKTKKESQKFKKKSRQWGCVN